MKYMLDTNICSYIIRHRPAEVAIKFQALKMNDCCISVMTYAELKQWVIKNKRLHLKSNNEGSPKFDEYIINNFVAHLDIVEFDAGAADIYAKICDDLEAKGKIGTNMDLLIAAHAISIDAVLVTNNIKDFVNIPNLQLENWVK